MAIACLLHCTVLHNPRVRNLSAASVSSLSWFFTALCHLYMTVFSTTQLKFCFHHSYQTCVALNRTTANFNSKTPIVMNTRAYWSSIFKTICRRNIIRNMLSPPSRVWHRVVCVRLRITSSFIFKLSRWMKRVPPKRRRTSIGSPEYSNLHSKNYKNFKSCYVIINWLFLLDQ
jgi:hypothetical protein